MSDEDRKECGEEVILIERQLGAIAFIFEKFEKEDDLLEIGMVPGWQSIENI